VGCKRSVGQTSKTTSIESYWTGERKSRVRPRGRRNRNRGGNSGKCETAADKGLGKMVLDRGPEDQAHDMRHSQKETPGKNAKPEVGLASLCFFTYRKGDITTKGWASQHVQDPPALAIQSENPLPRNGSRGEGKTGMAFWGLSQGTSEVFTFYGPNTPEGGNRVQLKNRPTFT